MSRNIEFLDGYYGAKAIIKTLWRDEFIPMLIDNDVQEIELNDGKGWHGDNVDFLKYFPQLKSLILIDLRIKNIEAIGYLTELRKLQLVTYSKKAVDFSLFPDLEECGFEWIDGSDSLFECPELKYLSINRYNKKSSDPLLKLVNLERLTISNSNIENLHGLSSLIKLQYLSITNLKHLKSLKGIECLPDISELEIYKCKNVDSVAEIFSLYSLKKLLLIDMGNIATLHGIENLVNLNTFMFYESTNITDGDLKPLLQLKKLSEVSYQNRRHYSHKREELEYRYMKMEIPKDKQEFIDAHFDETDKPTREDFGQLTTPEELHYVADNHNWDCGIEVLQWISESDLCSEATALLIFWRSQPGEYTEYSWDAKKVTGSHDIKVFDLIRTIAANFKKGFYKKTDISYDPKNDMPENDIVPEIMLQPTGGEEPYIYYNESDVASWFGEYLDNQLYRCDSAIELYNIAALLKYGTRVETYEKIINHPLCDKGIALMCFWRLRNYANLYGIEDISKEIIRRFENNEYQEVLKYNPNEDQEIKIQRMAKWAVPDEMRKAVAPTS